MTSIRNQRNITDIKSSANICKRQKKSSSTPSSRYIFCLVCRNSTISEPVSETRTDIYIMLYDFIWGLIRARDIMSTYRMNGMCLCPETCIRIGQQAPKLFRSGKERKQNLCIVHLQLGNERCRQ